MLVASISGSVDRAFTVFFAWVPALIGAVVVLLIGYLVARIVGTLVYRVAHRAGLDHTLHSGPGGNMIGQLTAKPSRLLGTIAFWAILLSTISLAASVLHIKALTAFIGAVWAYLPNVIVALLIFIVAGLLSTAVATIAKRAMGDTGIGRVVAAGVPILVMTIATFMILDQLKIAHNIVVITYAALLGAVALGSALAFGLGGRTVAERMLEGAYTTTQDNKRQWKEDLDQGASRAKEEVATSRERMAAHSDPRNDGDSGDRAPVSSARQRGPVGALPTDAPGETAYESAWDDPAENPTEQLR
jgi:hypothetical protein